MIYQQLELILVQEGTAGLASAAIGYKVNHQGWNLLEVTEEWSFPPPTAAVLTEGSLFLSGGTTLKGFGKAAGIPAATWASGGALNQPGRGPNVNCRRSTKFRSNCRRNSY